MARSCDVLFFAALAPPRDTGLPEIYRPLRLELLGRPATLPHLRALARGSEAETGPPPTDRGRAGAGAPLVLTPFLLGDALRRQGLVLRAMPWLEADPEAVKRALDDKPLLVALSTTWLPLSGGAELVRAAAARLRALAPEVPIVAGGVGVLKGLRARELLEQGRLCSEDARSLADDYLLLDAQRDRGLDAVVLAEGGEATLGELARCLREGRRIDHLPNLAFPTPDGYRLTARVPEPSDLEATEVDWSLHADALRGGEVPVRTSTGCPFRCTFCDFWGLHRVAYRSLPGLLRELRTLSALPPPRRVFLADDNIALSRRRLLALCDALCDARLDLWLRAFIRADAIDDETASRMRAAGFRECLLGVESADPVILKNMNKRLDPESSLQAIRCLDAQGINTQSTFVVGFPGENAQSLERTIAFLSQVPAGPGAGAVHRYYLFRFEVAALSPAASPENRERFGLRGSGLSWSHRTMDADEATRALHWVFRSVRGPTHMYLETLPPEWSAPATREVLELREAAERARLDGQEPDVQALLSAVRRAEISNNS